MEESKKEVSGGKKGILVIGIIATILIVGIITYIFVLSNKVKAWENKVYPGINVYGIDLTGLNKEEAKALLDEKLSAFIMDKKLNVLADDKKIEASYSEIDPRYDIENIVDEAFDQGKSGNLFSKKSFIENGLTVNIEPSISFSEEKLRELEERIKNEFNIKSKDAKIQINSGNIIITPDILGKNIDEEELHNKLIESINGKPKDFVELTFKLNEEEAKIKSSDLNKITGKISSYSSNYKDTNDDRVLNMKIATETVSGTLLMPDEEFSYNSLIGDTTPEKGYGMANTYVGNEIVSDYGGGICQVSTTLYRAAMKANLRSTERVNHSLTVSYSEPGLDATVANGVIDYKFINTYNFPIYIEGYVDEGKVSFDIYGNIEGMNGRTYELINEIHEKYNPQVKYEDDPTIYEGNEKVAIYGMPGYKASSYQITYENGVEVNREFISTDIYGTTDTVIKKGIKKKKV